LRRVSVAYFYLLPLIACFCLAVSCKKQIDNNVALIFSCANDEVRFDTVFTSIGSVTKKFTVYNPSNSDITTNIFLSGGKSSFYSINVNGLPGTDFKNVEIREKDSIFIFVKVNINPLDQNNPFLVTDAIDFLTGSKRQEVKLIAYGQDARYIVAGSNGYKIVANPHETTTWTKERPYVVYGWAAIDSLGTLIIEPGTKIYFHHNSGLWAYRYSKLIVGEGGSLDEPVLFRGDRLEKEFEDDYAQWNRIWINEGTNVSINNAIITNAFIGIQVDPLMEIIPTSVKIENTIVKNTKHCGVFGRFLSLEMTNCVITGNEGFSLQLEAGRYSMKHLTIANYYKWERKAPACFVSNKASDPIYSEMPAINTKVDFYNCIIYGKPEAKIETEIEVVKDNGAELEITFQHCLLRVKNSAPYFDNCLLNKDPKFKDINKLDFSLQSSSPAIGAGKPDIGVDNDILGKPRGDKPDIGAYQY